MNEFGLADGSTQGVGHTATGSFTLADLDGLGDLESVTINGTTITIANLLTAPPIVGAYGTLDITSYNASTGVVGYTYTLTTKSTDVPRRRRDGRVHAERVGRHDELGQPDADRHHRRRHCQCRERHQLGLGRDGRADHRQRSDQRPARQRPAWRGHADEPGELEQRRGSVRHVHAWRGWQLQLHAEQRQRDGQRGWRRE